MMKSKLHYCFLFQDCDRKDKDSLVPSITAAMHQMMTILAAPASSALKVKNRRQGVPLQK